MLLYPHSDQMLRNWIHFLCRAAFARPTQPHLRLKLREYSVEKQALAA